MNPIPLLVRDGLEGLSIAYGTSNDVDVHADIGFIIGPVSLTIFVPSGVTIGSTSIANAALDLSGLYDGSRIMLVNQGTIEGKGGAGGDAGSNGLLGLRGSGGGGGGGSGTVGGTAGEGWANPPATDGTAGTSGVAGDGGPGQDDATMTTTRATLDGGPAKEAIFMGNSELTIVNAGASIFGGGGGGGGGGYRDGNYRAGGDGGGPGVVGLDGDGATNPVLGSPARGVGGPPGFAIRHSGDVIFISGGTSPNVEGDIS
jgi:hypothetical protein